MAQRTPGPQPPVPGRTPRRVQRTRTRAGGMPAGALYVGRPTRWGNPYRVGDPGTPDRAAAVARYADHLAARPDLVEAARRHLTGRDLACWCPPGTPCHADLLLTTANPTPERTTPMDTPDTPDTPVTDLLADLNDLDDLYAALEDGRLKIYLPDCPCAEDD